MASEDLVTAPARWQHLAKLEQDSPGGYNALNQCAIYGAISPIAEIPRSRNQGVEIQVAPLSITPSDPLAKFLHPALVTLCSADLEALVPKGGTFLPRDNDSIELEVKTSTSHFGYHMPLNQQAKNGVTMLARVTILHYYYSLQSPNKKEFCHRLPLNTNYSFPLGLQPDSLPTDLGLT